MDKETSRYENLLSTSRAWKKNNPERHAELAKAYRARNKEKTRAQNLLNYAVRTGKIERGKCEVCGTVERVHAHHHDYNKPYDVRWLCFMCHKKSHPVDDEDKSVKFTDARRAALFGSSNPYSSLTDTDVKQIRQMLDIGVSQQKIANAFGVHQTAISKIKLGQSWSHLK